MPRMPKDSKSSGSKSSGSKSSGSKSSAASANLDPQLSSSDGSSGDWQVEDWQAEDWQSEDWSYEDTLIRIEAITHQLETGELPLADVFECFEEAVGALQQCDQFLQAKQKQASLLIETLVGEEADAS